MREKTLTTAIYTMWVATLIWLIIQERKMNKTDAVRNHLTSGKSLTSLEAIDKWKATRLSAIIFNLKHDEQLDIVDQWESYTGQDGDTTRFKRYWIRK